MLSSTLHHLTPSRQRTLRRFTEVEDLLHPWTPISSPHLLDPCLWIMTFNNIKRTSLSNRHPIIRSKTTGWTRRRLPVFSRPLHKPKWSPTRAQTSTKRPEVHQFTSQGHSQLILARQKRRNSLPKKIKTSSCKNYLRPEAESSSQWTLVYSLRQ